MAFYPAERTILLVIGALGAICAALAWSKNVSVSLDFFTFSLAFGGALIVIGQFYRRTGRSEAIALMAHALALFVSYSVFGALFNVLLLPRATPPMDAALVGIDAWFGYSWPGLCAWIAQYPVAAGVLRTVYSMTLVQFLFVFMFLGLSLDRRRLHASALATVIASLTVIFCWALFPSSGASAFWTLDPDIDRIVRPFVGSAAGAEINRLLVEGVSDVSTLTSTGLIGFPSFHTVMVLMPLLAIWPYRTARILLIGLFALSVPAILIDGGHNLMDVFAGAAICLASWWLGLKAFDAQERLAAAGAMSAAAVPAE